MAKGGGRVADAKKTVLGQFFTTDALWLKPQVAEFIRQSGCTVAYDPFAGEGHLLRAARERLGFAEVRGLDIDPSLGWEQNDSLRAIPHVEGAIILTNPPYLSNYSAARKKVGAGLTQYFAASEYDDLYLIALDRMREAQQHVVAIVPETFLNSAYRGKNALSSVTVLEENPFGDTDAPVVVLCFDGRVKPPGEIAVYKGERAAGTLETIEAARIRPDHSVPVTFNDPGGWLAVRAIDSTDPNDMLRFDYKANIAYDWDKGIKVSSRLLTLVTVDVPEEKRDAFLARCNAILAGLREASDDLIFSPFKGNMKNGRRRRRLDFLTCRAIIERAWHESVEETDDDQLGLF